MMTEEEAAALNDAQDRHYRLHVETFLRQTAGTAGAAADWSPVSSDGNTSRMPVPGGWLYRDTRASNLAFVPKAEAEDT